MVRRIYSSNHLEVARALRHIGVACSCLKHYHEALLYLNEALIIYKDNFSDDHEDITKIKNEILQLKQQCQLINETFFFPILLLRY